MKILQVIEGLGKASGVTTFVENVVFELRALGHTVDICTKSNSSNSNIQIFKHSNIYDVVHIHGLWSPFLHRASVVAKRHRIPVIWSTHGMTAPWSLKHKWWKKCLPWYLYQKWDLQRAVFIHSTVELEAKWNADLGFTRGFIAPLGTHLPKPLPPPQSPATNHQPPTTKTLLFVGRVYPVKALDRLIEAFQGVSNAEWNLRIVGPDQAGHMDELKALVSSLSLDGQVEFTGPRFDEDLAAEYANSDCLALVSHTENFGATVVDAMAYGKPVITSTQTPWREVAERQCGWWVDNEPASLAKALREMMSLSDSERIQMGLRGRKLVEEKYTWQAVAKKLEWAYGQAVNQCPMAPCVACDNYGDTCPMP